MSRLKSSFVSQIILSCYRSRNSLAPIVGGAKFDEKDCTTRRDLNKVNITLGLT